MGQMIGKHTNGQTRFSILIYE